LFVNYGRNGFIKSAPDSTDACRYIADNCKANILVVEDDKQLEKVLKFRAEVSSIKVASSSRSIYTIRHAVRHDTLFANI
jgi:hypothetical protein